MARVMCPPGTNDSAREVDAVLFTREQGVTAVLAGPAAGVYYLVRGVLDIAEHGAAAAYLRMVVHRLRQSALARLIPAAVGR